MSENDPAALHRIERALRQLGASYTPPPGWEARVLSQIAAPRRRSRWAFAAPAAAAAALAALVLWLWPHEPEPLALAYVVVPTNTVVRGDFYLVGDTVKATARGGRHRALRIYGPDGALLAACPGGDGCRATDDALSIDFRLASIGTYSIVAIGADAPVSAPTGHFDEDMAGAVSAGVQYKAGEVTAR